MPKAEHPPFVRRPNRDGTVDSICTRCVLTVATSRYEYELEALELAHLCDSSRIEHWKSLSNSEKRPR